MIKKILKRLGMILGGCFILFIITVFISSLNLYTEDDFNIPEGAMQTKFYDKDPYSDENGFNDLVEFENFIVGKTGFFDVESKCIFDQQNGTCKAQRKKYMEELRNDTRVDDFEKNKELIIEQKLNKFKRVVHINQLKFQHINSKEYILEIPEYYGIDGMIVNISPLFEYFRGLRYVIYTYFEKGEYDKGIQLLLSAQNFLDHLINNSDLNLISTLAIFTISNMYLETVEYFLDHYSLSDSLQDDIKTALEDKIHNGGMANAVKREMISHRDLIIDTFDSATIKENSYGNIFSYYKGMTKRYLFFSIEETKLLFDKLGYDIVTRDGKEPDWKCRVNIKNYIGRTLICDIYKADYGKLFQKEQDLIDFRKRIVERLE